MSEKILIVDDDAETLRLVRLMLQREGFEVIAASDGFQALDMAKSDTPDLILLDIMMPKPDGLEVTRHLRSDALTQQIPIVMFTAKTQVEDKILGFEAGADDYVTKPTQPRELVAHIKAVLARTWRVRPAIAAPIKERGYTIGVMAVRGGLGVSTLALNLGVSLYNICKQAVIVAEFRPGQGSIGPELGYLLPEGLSHLLQRQPAKIDFAAVETELVEHASGVRLLLASTRPRDVQLANAAAHFEAIAHHLAHNASYLVIDLGSMLTPLAEKMVQQCDQVLILVEPGAQTLSRTKALIEDLAELGIGSGRLSYVLLNRVRSDTQLSVSQVQEQLNRNLSAVITPAPELIHQAFQNNQPVVNLQPESLIAQQFVKLAEKIAQKKS